MVLYEPIQQPSVFDIVSALGGLGTSGLVTHIARQVILGLQALQRADVAHRDIKLQNVRLNLDYDCALGGLEYAEPTHDSSR